MEWEYKYREREDKSWNNKDAEYAIWNSVFRNRKIGDEGSLEKHIELTMRIVYPWIPHSVEHAKSIIMADKLQYRKQNQVNPVFCLELHQ